MPADTTKISVVIRNARRAKKMSQEALAESIGISSRTIGDIETEKRKPSYRILNKLIYALDIPRELLFPEEAKELDPDIELFISEFKSANRQAQALIMASARGILDYLHVNKKN